MCGMQESLKRKKTEKCRKQGRKERRKERGREDPDVGMEKVGDEKQ